MAKRKGLPKPSATGRTWYRYRMRNDLETPEDTKRFEFYEKVKEALFPKEVPKP